MSFIIFFLINLLDMGYIITDEFGKAAFFIIQYIFFQMFS
jgi:hypothetical protein